MGPAGSSGGPYKEVIVYRHPVNKHKSAKQFKRNVGKTKSINLRGAPMRGGIRL